MRLFVTALWASALLCYGQGAGGPDCSSCHAELRQKMTNTAHDAVGCATCHIQHEPIPMLSMRQYRAPLSPGRQKRMFGVVQQCLQLHSSTLGFVAQAPML